MDVRSALGALGRYGTDMLGDNRVCVAVLDGPVDLTHPCFDGADLERLDTLVAQPVGDGPMSLHGTHVASLLFGQPGSPVVGLAPRCRGLLLPIFGDEQRGSVSQLDLARAIERAVAEGAHVVSVSGGERTPTAQATEVLQQALRRCDDNNVLVVAAVGNDDCACLQVPAAVSSVLAAGAIGAGGRPLEASNWGGAYRSNGVLAPGEDIVGACPGGGTARLTGSSFATPIVSGAAALLLSRQAQLRLPLNPRAARRSIMDSAIPCLPDADTDCRRYLAGTLHIPGAYAFIDKGAMQVMTQPEVAEPSVGPASSTVAHADDHRADTVVSDANDQPAMGVTPACGPHLPGAATVVADTVNETRPNAALRATPGEIEPAATVLPATADSAAGILPASGDCACDGAKSYIFAIGTLDTDFGTLARRDSFRQLMPRVQVSDSPPTSVPPNPYDVTQLCDYLDENPWECTKLIWTLNLEATPIYALEAELAYADRVYEILRAALRNQALPTSDDNYVSRISIPGVLTSRTRQLFSGQTVPVVTVAPRGLYSWNETALVNQVVEAVQRDRDDVAGEHVRQTVRNFLNAIYYKLRNLGQSPPDRALNYSATNAFIFTAGVAEGLLSARNVPGGDNLYTLDTISVFKSPFCRMDSDCWEVQITFFDPENHLRARCVYQYTIDVSDQMPVSLAPSHQFLITR